MKSVLDVDVSWFANYRTPDNPRLVNLLSWLISTQYADNVESIRATLDKKERDRIKATLPAITPSGLFTRRESSALIQHSGLVCLDIDPKGNEGITNYSDLKAQISRIQNVAYCGLSASGTGLFVLIPILYPERHGDQFNALRILFGKRLNVRIDDTPDVSRLRGYSHDADAYFNHAAPPFGGIYTPPVKQSMRIGRDYSPSTSETTQAKVEEVLSQLRARSADITGDYRQWFEIACALADEFGEQGREYFHEVSQYYPGYQDAETEKQFDYALKQRYPYTIGTFFEYARQAGFIPQARNTSRPASSIPTQPPAPRPAVAPPEPVVPRTSSRSFYEFTRQNPAFRWLGLASLTTQS